MSTRRHRAHLPKLAAERLPWVTPEAIERSLDSLEALRELLTDEEFEAAAGERTKTELPLLGLT